MKMCSPIFILFCLISEVISRVTLVYFTLLLQSTGEEEKPSTLWNELGNS